MGLRLFKDFGGCVDGFPLYTDYTGSPASQRTKHLDVRYHRFRDEQQKLGKIALFYVHTADCFTKALAKPAFQKCMEAIGMTVS